MIEISCNCGKPKPRPKPPAKFILYRETGAKQEFGSRLEAEAQYVRDGRRGSIKPII